jgi:hypothetical protein
MFAVLVPCVSSPQVFAKTQAILPLDVTTHDMHNGDCTFADTLTLLVHTPDTTGTVVTQVRSRRLSAMHRACCYVVSADGAVIGRRLSSVLLSSALCLYHLHCRRCASSRASACSRRTLPRRHRGLMR